MQLYGWGLDGTNKSSEVRSGDRSKQKRGTQAPRLQGTSKRTPYTYRLGLIVSSQSDRYNSTICHPCLSLAPSIAQACPNYSSGG
ncbi:hypothetical protein FIBSPDRAFT_876577, partial [Athelia psychrophila]